MSPSMRTLAVAVLAALVALSAFVWPRPLWLMALILAVLVAQGWAQLLRLPAAGLVALIVGAAGVAMVIVSWTFPQAEIATALALVLAAALVLAFATQMLRNPRPDLVATVSGIITGVAVQLGLVGWILAARTAAPAVVQVEGPWWGLPLVIEAALTLAGLALAGTALFQNWPGAARVDRAFLWRGQSTAARRGALAGAAAIVAVAGVVPLVVARLLGGWA